MAKKEKGSKKEKKEKKGKKEKKEKKGKHSKRDSEPKPKGPRYAYDTAVSALGTLVCGGAILCVIGFLLAVLYAIFFMT